MTDIEELLNETEDKEEIEMLKEESSGIKAELPNLEEELKILLIPKDPNDEKMLSSKLELLQVEMKRLFSQVT